MTGKLREKYHVIYLRCWRCGHYHFTTHQIRIIQVDVPLSSWYAQPLEYSQASENGMEALELDTPTEMINAPENTPPSKGLTADLQI